MSVDNSKLEFVGHFLTRIQADIACGALNASGIEAVVVADDLGGTRPHLWTEGVRILVHAEDVERARAVLREGEDAKA